MALVVLVGVVGVTGSSPAGAVPLLVLGGLGLAVSLLGVRNVREITASSWMFGVEAAGLRLADHRSPGGHVLVPWAEIRNVRTSFGAYLSVRLSPAGAARFRRRALARRMLSLVPIAFPMRWSPMPLGDAVAAIEARATGLTGRR
jgi:hypothetical protein